LGAAPCDFQRAGLDFCLSRRPIRDTHLELTPNFLETRFLCCYNSADPRYI